MVDPILPVPETEAEPEEPKLQPKPAVTLVIHSWAMPIVGVVMLAIGLISGYFGHQLISPGAATPVATTQPAAAVPTGASEGSQSQPDPQQVMAYLVSQTRHFKGNANAPVTIIEFSDYQ